jgi:nucleoside-diphosphate-sugar epimerase
MKVLITGGTGHVGKFMVPKLVKAGATVSVATSGKTPFPSDRIWSEVQTITCNLINPDEIEKLKAVAPDVVIDMTGYVWDVYQKLKGTAKHFIACGSLWMYGDPKIVPTPEKTQNKCVFEHYSKRYPEILRLIELSRKDGVAFTALMPSNICGPGKVPIECRGGRNPEIHKLHSRGEEVVLPDGADALISPCDAKDIAEGFVKAVFNRDKVAQEILNIGSAYAITATQLVHVYSDVYNVEIPIKRVPWEKYVTEISPGIGYWWHFKSHMCPDISKARQILGYEPEFTPEQSIARAVEWMKSEKII